ncbi:unnamed protein product, partial [Vitis vinifera]
MSVQSVRHLYRRKNWFLFMEGGKHLQIQGYGFMGGFMPMASARFGNLTLSAAFGGLIPSLLNLHVHGFHDATVYGTTSGFPYGFSNSFHGGHAHGFHHHHASHAHQSDFSFMKRCLLFIGLLVIISLIWM